MIQSFLVKFACVDSTLISEQCVCIQGFVFNQLTASWTDVTLLHSTTLFWQPLHWWPTWRVGNIFFNYRRIGSHTCNKKATHIHTQFWKYHVLVTIIWAQIESKLQWTFWQLYILLGQLVDISQCLYSGRCGIGTLFQWKFKSDIIIIALTSQVDQPWEHWLKLCWISQIHKCKLVFWTLFQLLSHSNTSRPV